MLQHQVSMLDFSNGLELNKVKYHNESHAGQTCAIKQLTMHDRPNVSLNGNYVFKSFSATLLYVLTFAFSLLVDSARNECDKCNFVAKLCDLYTFKKDADHLLKLPLNLQSDLSFHEKSQVNKKLFNSTYDWLKLCKRLSAHIEKLLSYVRVSPRIRYTMCLHLVRPYNIRNVVDRCKKYNFIELVICVHNHQVATNLSFSKYMLYFKFVIKWLNCVILAN